MHQPRAQHGAGFFDKIIGSSTKNKQIKKTDETEMHQVSLKDRTLASCQAEKKKVRQAKQAEERAAAQQRQAGECKQEMDQKEAALLAKKNEDEKKRADEKKAVDQRKQRQERERKAAAKAEAQRLELERKAEAERKRQLEEKAIKQTADRERQLEEKKTRQQRDRQTIENLLQRGKSTVSKAAEAKQKQETETKRQEATRKAQKVGLFGTDSSDIDCANNIRRLESEIIQFRKANDRLESNLAKCNAELAKHSQKAIADPLRRFGLVEPDETSDYLF